MGAVTRVHLLSLLALGAAQDLFLSVNRDKQLQLEGADRGRKQSPSPSPTPPAPPAEYKFPSIELSTKNAAKPGMRYPTIGLGYHSPGCTIGKTIGGKKPECWRWPMCCKGNHCPLINATREWLKMGGARLDTMWPFTTRNTSSTGEFNDYVGIYHGIHQAMDQSGLQRKDIFITTKGDHYSLAGYGGGKHMFWQALQDLDLKYVDLYMLHNGDNSARGHGGDGHCYDRRKDLKGYDARLCRIETWKGAVEQFHQGAMRALGVSNFQASWLQEFKDAGVLLPAIVQHKHHLHHTTTDDVKDMIKFCKENDIVFEAYSPLGAPDFITFEPSVGKPTLLEEDLVKEIASKANKSPAQVLLKWQVQQGFAAAVRSMVPARMKENLDVFNWSLEDADMQRLSAMSQCQQMNGNPFLDPSCPTFSKEGNMTGPTKYC